MEKALIRTNSDNNERRDLSVTKRVGLIIASSVAITGIAIGASELANDSNQNDTTSGDTVKRGIKNGKLSPIMHGQHYDSRSDSKIMPGYDHLAILDQSVDGSFSITAKYPSKDNASVNSDDIVVIDGVSYDPTTTFEVYSEKAIDVEQLSAFTQSGEVVVISEVTGPTKNDENIFDGGGELGHESRIYTIDNPENLEFTLSMRGESSAAVHVWQGEALVPIA